MKKLEWEKIVLLNKDREAIYDFKMWVVDHYPEVPEAMLKPVRRSRSLFEAFKNYENIVSYYGEKNGANTL